MKHDPLKLPRGWVGATIGELIPAEGIFIDGDWVESKDQDPDGDVRLIQLADVGDGVFRDKSSRFLTRQKAQQLNCTFLEKGDLLIARMPDPLGRCCIFPLSGARKFVTVVDVCAVRLGKKSANPKFLAHLINSPQVRAAIGALQSGSTRKRISRGNLATIKMRIAPRLEQDRIVAKLEELFSELEKGIEYLAIAQEQLKAYRQAVLKNAFEGKLTAEWREKNKSKLKSAEELIACIQRERDVRYEQQLVEWKSAIMDWERKGKKGKKPSKPKRPETIALANLPSTSLPTGWAWVAVGNLNVEVFDGPFGSNLKTSDYVADGVRVIRLENIGHLEFLDDKRSYVTTEKYKSLAKHTVRSGDIIVSSFVTDGIRVAILPNTVAQAVNKADCFCLRVCGVTVRNEFVASFLASRTAYKQVESEVHGIGRPRINTTQLRGFAVPLCSREEQNEIISLLHEKWSLADNVETVIRNQVDKCEALRQSILKLAIMGGLVSQDPNEESALMLLERIKSEKAGQNKDTKNNKRMDAA
ncbi:MAG: restriction endonuclease subunit S [Alphaproteobacteria bacterium]|nr:restriction endonuclease subunit S [Alphaproteobacteria bacterium]